MHKIKRELIHWLHTTAVTDDSLFIKLYLPNGYAIGKVVTNDNLWSINPHENVLKSILQTHSLELDCFVILQNVTTYMDDYCVKEDFVIFFLDQIVGATLYQDPDIRL